MLRFAPALLLLAACSPAKQGIVGRYTADSTIFELAPDGRALVMPRLTAGGDPDTTFATIYSYTTRGDVPARCCAAALHDNPLRPLVSLTRGGAPEARLSPLISPRRSRPLLDPRRRAARKVLLVDSPSGEPIEGLHEAKRRDGGERR